MKRFHLEMLRLLFQKMPLGICTMALALLFFTATGCHNDTSAGVWDISPRDAAVEKALAWEKKRYGDILNQTKIPVYGFRVLGEMDHDETAFTEGLVINRGVLYESAGLWGQSRLTVTDLRTGQEMRRHDLPPIYFGEGITVLGDEVFQMTYQSCVGFVYGKDDFQLHRTFHFGHQGWGLTDDGEQLIMSNGSAALIFVDPVTMAPTRYVVVSDSVGPVGNLNELAYVDGEVYANIFKTDLIVRASSETGAVTGWIDMSGINPAPNTLKDPFVLNGIAYDGETGHFFVTGKSWPKIYEIELILRQ